MRLSIIGGGTMGKTHAANAAVMPGVVAAGVCDIDADTAAGLAAVLQTEAYTELTEMVKKEQPDVVLVCLPTPLHKPTVLQLAELGVHVICEKPLASSLEDALEMKAACEKHQVKLMIGHVVRFFPNYRQAFERIKEGKIGSPRTGHFKRFGSFPKGAGNWYHDRAKSGGVILDLMIHDIDYACSVFGKVDTVFCQLVERQDPAIEYAQVTLRFANRSVAQLEAYWGYPGAFTTAFEIAGEQGVLRFDSDDTSALTVSKPQAAAVAGPSVQVPSSPTIHNPYYLELAHFLHCIKTDTQPDITVDDACEAVRVALAAEKSAQLQKPVRMEAF